MFKKDDQLYFRCFPVMSINFHETNEIKANIGTKWVNLLKFGVH